MRVFQQTMALFLSWCLVVLGAANSFAWQTDPSGSQQPPQAVQQSTQQIEQLVAPIALYPDALIAQILPAATYPDQVAEAGRWMAEHKALTGDALAQEVDKQSWDPSVKALTQFPAVLANMNQNLAWTSELGDAYANQQPELNNAIQTMRERAKQAGNLQSTSEQKVSNKGKTIIIQSAAPDVVYVPQYDPWLVYGAPLAMFPGWYPYPGLFLDGPGIAFGLGFGIGLFGGFGWGFHHWGYDWHRGGRVVYNHNTYISHSRTIVNRNNFNGGRSNFDHGAGFRGRASNGHQAVRGSSAFHGSSAVHDGPGSHSGLALHSPAVSHSGAFGGFNHGGVVRSNSSRGQSSFGGFHGGGGGFHGGGGGFHGGGGGGRR